MFLALFCTILLNLHFFDFFSFTHRIRKKEKKINFPNYCLINRPTFKYKRPGANFVFEKKTKKLFVEKLLSSDMCLS